MQDFQIKRGDTGHSLFEILCNPIQNFFKEEATGDSGSKSMGVTISLIPPKFLGLHPYGETADSMLPDISYGGKVRYIPAHISCRKSFAIHAVNEYNSRHE
jgi:hypothetical protein